MPCQNVAPRTRLAAMLLCLVRLARLVSFGCLGQGAIVLRQMRRILSTPLILDQVCSMPSFVRRYSRPVLSLIAARVSISRKLTSLVLAWSLNVPLGCLHVVFRFLVRDWHFVHLLYRCLPDVLPMHNVAPTPFRRDPFQ